MRMQPQGEAESGGQPFGYILSFGPTIVAPEHPAMILLVKQSGLGRMGQDFVGALAPFRQRFRREIGPNSLVSRMPVCPAVITPENSGRRDTDPHCI